MQKRPTLARCWRTTFSSLGNFQQLVPPAWWPRLFLNADDALKTLGKLTSGADVNCRTMLGWTPLRFIAMQGQTQASELAKVFIAHGLDLSVVDNQGRSWRDHWQHGKKIYALLENASKQ